MRDRVGVLSRPAPGVGYELQPVECAVCGVGAEQGSRPGDQSTAGSTIPEKLCSFFQDLDFEVAVRRKSKTGS